MQSAVKEVIEEDIWGSLLEFLRFPIMNFESGGNEIRITVGVVLLVAVVFAITSMFLRFLRMVITRKMQDDDKLKFISVFRFLKYLLYLIVVIATLSSVGIDITILITASAAFFVGLGLALQDLFKDIIGGIFIITDRTLRMGDIIEMNGRVGRVINIRLRTTRVLTRDDKVMVIPNHKFITEVILNYTQNHKTTMEFVRVRVSYNSDIQLVKAILLECAKEQTGLVKKPMPFVVLDDFGESAMLFNLHFFVSDSFVDPKVKSELRFKIHEKFRINNIAIPFPQMDLKVINSSNSSGSLPEDGR